MSALKASTFSWRSALRSALRCFSKLRVPDVPLLPALLLLPIRPVGQRLHLAGE